MPYNKVTKPSNIRSIEINDLFEFVNTINELTGFKATINELTGTTDIYHETLNINSPVYNKITKPTI